MGYRRLQVRDERRADMLLGLMHLVGASMNQPKE
jgi:hypothetical protein